MIIHPDSHVDHVPQSVVDLVLERYRDREAFFTDTFELPADATPLECALYGPKVGDEPVHERDTEMKPRGTRGYNSRMCNKRPRLTRTCTVIGGPHDGKSCVLFTVFGGPLTPKEPNDPYLKPEERAASVEFWDQHALAALPSE